jgi:hypothetical protein
MQWTFERKVQMTALGVAILGAILALATFLRPIISREVDVRYKVHDPVSILNLTAATPNLRFTIDTPKAAITNMTVTNVAYRRVEIWNKGYKSANDARIRISCKPPSVLAVLAETFDPHRFGEADFERPTATEVIITLSRITRGEKPWWKNIVVIGTDHDLSVNISGQDWAVTENK